MDADQLAKCDSCQRSTTGIKIEPGTMWKYSLYHTGLTKNWTYLPYFIQSEVILSYIRHMRSALIILTHWGRDKMGAISQTTFSIAFSWMKMFKYRLKFHWNVFLMVQLTIFQHWLDAVQATNHYLNQWCLAWRRIYASLWNPNLMLYHGIYQDLIVFFMLLFWQSSSILDTHFISSLLKVQ